MKPTLTEIYYSLCAQGYCSDKGTYHSYVDIYSELLEPYRNGSILEIGVFKGDSLRMWEQYFNEAYGIDCSDQPHGGMADLREMIASGEHNIYIGDGCSKEFIDTHFKDKKFSVVIIDASHDLDQEIEMFHLYKDYVSPGGKIIIEDPQNIDRDKNTYLSLCENVEIIDRRNIKNRYDDCLIICNL